MKKILICLNLLFLGFMTASLHSETLIPPNSSILFARQSSDLLQALKKQDMHQIHELSETIGDEAIGKLQRLLSLKTDQPRI